MSGRVICDKHRLYEAGCSGCRARNREYQRYRRKQVAYGRWHPGGRYVDAHEARVHIDALWQEGKSYRAMAAAAGVSAWTIRNIVSGAGTQISRDVNDRILALSTVATQPANLVPKTGTTRRLQALGCNGWPRWVVLQRALGWKRGSSMTGKKKQLFVTVRVHEAIKQFFEEHWDVPGPSEVTRRNAQRLGWVPAQCWDDDTIDDPAAQPQGLLWTHPAHPRHHEMTKRHQRKQRSKGERDVA